MSFVADAEMSSIVLANVVRNQHYAAKVAPYLDVEFFANDTERAICGVVSEYHATYSKAPSAKETVVMLKDLPNVNSLDKHIVNDVLGKDAYMIESQEWLEKYTEKFIRRRRVSLAFEKTYGDFEEGGEVDSYANIFQEAISFHFDNSVGHDLVEDCHLRYDMYTSDEDRKSLFLEMLDLVTNGGVPSGTLNCFLAGTGVGKSLMMCDIAAKAALAGNKVLYISLEMAELRLAERLEANLMDVPLNQMKKLSKSEFTVKQQHYINKMKAKGGTCVFKQYPTSSAHAGHFRNLLIEAKNKKGVEFDYVFIDYLNICATNRGNASDNSYTKIKNIAEELRALAVEFDLPIITATQTNRGGQSSTDLSFEDVSESHGLAATLDLLIGIISTEEWEAVNKIMMVQIKNRYGDVNYYRKFMVGIERAKMRLYDLKKEASDGVNKSQIKQSNQAMSMETLDISVLGSKKATPSLNGLKT